MEPEYLEQLNGQQRDAVVYCDGPQLVIAGAGSGKTRVLTYKIVHLLTQGYEPWRIIALTFTNKAAREMRERIEQLVGPKTSSRLWMGTFHSLFSRILRQHADRIGYKSNYTIYDAADSKSLVKTIIKDLELDDKIYKPSTVLNSISTAKNALISPEEYRRLPDVMEADRRARRPQIVDIYRIYRDRCLSAGAMDFDDLLYYTNVLLRDNPDILHHYQEYFRYILVDEYQDTNFAQHAIITRLSEGSRRLCVVGDDAQSIYSFRGANIRNILNLQNTYSDLRIFKLERNYRSTRNIIEAANSLIDKNTEQIRKHVFSENEAGARIEVARSFSDFEEAFLVANRISQIKMQRGESYDEFAILYRTNAQSRILEESLRKRNIPYRIYGGLSFYQRKEVKDAIAYFRLSINPDDDEALRRVINFPARGIGETTLNRLTRAAIDNKVSIWHIIGNIDNYNPGLNSGAVKKLKAFHSLIEGFVAMNREDRPADEVASSIIDTTGLLAMLLSDRTPESISKRENLEELIAGVKQFVETAKEEGSDATSLADFMSEVSLATDQDVDEETDEAKVTLMTVHAAKGLEFSNVFIVGVEMDLFPSAMSQNSVYEIEEERRLLYVAITRAKKFCMMSYASSRFRNGQTVTCSPSPFLRDIDPAYLLPVTGTDIAPSSPRVDPAGRYRSEAMRPSGSTTSWRSGSRSSSGPVLRSIGGSAQRGNSAPSSQTQSSGHFTTFPASALREGMRVNHRTFGSGTITEIDTTAVDHKITVDFDNTGVKKLLLKFAKIEIIK